MELSYSSSTETGIIWDGGHSFSPRPQLTTMNRAPCHPTGDVKHEWETFVVLSYWVLSYCAFPNGSAGEESTCNTGDTGDAGLIRGSGRFPGGGNGSPFQYSCLKNPMDRGTWWATVQRVTKSQTRLSTKSTHTELLHSVIWII